MSTQGNAARRNVQVPSTQVPITQVSGPEGGTTRKGSRAKSSDASAISADEDRVFIERARYGDADAFEALVNKYHSRAIGIARNFVFDREAARDVSQEAFLRVYRSLDRYDPKQRFYTWFYRIVVHLSIDHMRRNKNTPKRLGERDDVGWAASAPRSSVPGEDTRQSAPSLGLEQSETREQVESVLEQLPKKYRLLLVLRDLEGFTSKEISDIAGWNHATVRWRLHRARRLFRQAWESAGFPVDGVGLGSGPNDVDCNGKS